jgi:hypothetical protein
VQNLIEVDASLLPYLRAADEDEADSLLAQLISDCADPTIRGILKNKLHVSLNLTDGRPENQDALEIVSDVHAQLLADLHDLKDDKRRDTICNFRGYVAVITYHACYQHLRQKNPERWQLKNKVRYLLTHRPVFDLWKDGTQAWVCGFSGWRAVDSISSSKLTQLRDTGAWFSINEPQGTDVQPAALTKLLTAIFERCGQPIALEEIVNLVASLYGICRPTQAKQRTLSSREVSGFPLSDVVALTEHRIHLAHLWSEIRELPLRHRAALLLNLRDARGGGVIHLLPLTRVATIRELADSLGFAHEDFALVWNELPWDDARIADYFGFTRQQVINLRQSARARLARHVKGF